MDLILVSGEEPKVTLRNQRRVIHFERLGIFVECTGEGTNAMGHPLWRTTAVGVMLPEEAHLGFTYPGPVPQNLELGWPRRQCAELLGNLKLKPVAAGVAHSSLVAWERYDPHAGDQVFFLRWKKKKKKI